MKLLKGIKIATLVTASAALVASLVYDNKNKQERENIEESK